MSQSIQFVDQTIRDGQQSLWGFTLRTDMVTPIAETMDQVGYRNIATVGSQAFKVQVRSNKLPVMRDCQWECRWNTTYFTSSIRYLAGVKKVFFEANSTFLKSMPGFR